MVLSDELFLTPCALDKYLPCRSHSPIEPGGTDLGTSRIDCHHYRRPRWRIEAPSYPSQGPGPCAPKQGTLPCPTTTRLVHLACARSDGLECYETPRESQ